MKFFARLNSLARVSLTLSAFAVLAAMASMAMFAGAAHATPTCSYDSDTGKLLVRLNANGDRVTFYGQTANITVYDVNAQANLPCAGGPVPKTEAEKVTAKDTTNNGDTWVSLITPDNFRPGGTDEFGTSEIEFEVALGGGDRDRFNISQNDTAAADWRLGSDGINVNPANSSLLNDVEVVTKGVERSDVLGSNGADTIDANGGAGTGDPYPRPLKIFGGNAADFLGGGAGADTIEGFLGSDSMRGRGGNDLVKAQDGAADALISCGSGTNDEAQVDPEDPPANSC